MSLTLQLSRSTLQIAKSAALADSPPGFWRVAQTRSTAKSTLTKAATGKPSGDLQHLREKGISAKDEKKIVALRDFIYKQAHASKA